MGRIRIGVSGWSYDEWKGKFYPDDLHDGDQLAFAASKFDSIEINGTFYSLTDPQTCRQWRAAVPAGFRFAVKGSRYITHVKRLTDSTRPMANFFASGILELGETLGPVLWQLPANFAFDAERVGTFLDSLPSTTSEAADLARRHDDRVKEASYGDGVNHRIRHVLEFRHRSFLDARAAALARDAGVALCFSHGDQWPYTEEITAGFVYLRLHGPRKLYASNYGQLELNHWARRVIDWRDGVEPEDAEQISKTHPPTRKSRDVYVYFNNTAHGYAPQDAFDLVAAVEHV